MATKTNNPFLEFDPSKFMGDFKLPGVDVEAILSSQRKNIEALTAANQLAAEGFQAVLRRQAEIVRSSVEEASSFVNDVLSASTPEAKAAKQAELVKAAFEKALANARELAELVTKSNTEAADVLSKRVSESLEELKSAVAKVAK
ncbi:phasin family protein [Azospirillum cavernae]|uniref:Phasin family protein n=1 Tax=Azospirillum cavernae TaxID=2320860 RepID=A0A418W4X8_9PROT|nr:phasin family protein [Azospirillum cavernae]RJF84997.1 phasin family protein [Azospirillum cavernae]